MDGNRKRFYIITFSIVLILLVGVILGYIVFSAINGSRAYQDITDITVTDSAGNQKILKCLAKADADEESTSAEVEYGGKIFNIGVSPREFSSYEIEMINSINSCPLPEKKSIGAK